MTVANSLTLTHEKHHGKTLVETYQCRPVVFRLSDSLEEFFDQRMTWIDL